MFSGIINTFDQIKIRVAKELVHRMWESLAVCGRRTKALSFCFAKFTWFVSPIHCVDFVDSGQDSLQSLPLEIQPVLWGKGVGLQCDWHPAFENKSCQCFPQPTCEVSLRLGTLLS